MTRISVPDMSCGHCKASIEQALSPLVSRLQIDLPARELTAEGAAPAQLLQALAAIGFPAKTLD